MKGRQGGRAQEERAFRHFRLVVQQGRVLEAIGLDSKEGKVLTKQMA